MERLCLKVHVIQENTCRGGRENMCAFERERESVCVCRCVRERDVYV